MLNHSELARQTRFAHTTVLHILKESLGMRKIALRWVPHNWTEMQKWLRYDAARTRLKRYGREGEAFLRHIITLDETWARSYQLKLKQKSKEWRHYGPPRSSKFLQNPSNVKVMLILVPALRQKWLHFLRNVPIILHDNARPHVAQAVSDLFDQWRWEVLYHPPYSSDLIPCDFDLIPKRKESFRDIRFKTVPEILAAIDHSNYQQNRRCYRSSATSTSLETSCTQCYRRD
ncbi:histone-lysine N-methyltransferase SETMAR-like [Argiope bruennichi]|uniref:histone-lysine N-methyltransferase SETMAR-like n=1 Tax=Argiope bruennichi TaxID=94029 RepID=UPI002494034F|nr:histone-lysine N-methyltransferase SETMAR-like [Argiope bruennichi]